MYVYLFSLMLPFLEVTLQTLLRFLIETNTPLLKVTAGLIEDIAG